MNKKILKWVNMTAFVILLLGGLNFLMMGLFNFDMYAAMFGGTGSAASRVFYSLFGIAAVALLAIILWKAFTTSQKKPATKTTTTTTTTKTA